MMTAFQHFWLALIDVRKQQARPEPMFGEARAEWQRFKATAPL